MYRYHHSGNPESNDQMYSHIQTALKAARNDGYTIDANTRAWGIKYALDHDGIFLGPEGSDDIAATITRA